MSVDIDRCCDRGVLQCVLDSCGVTSLFRALRSLGKFPLLITLSRNLFKPSKLFSDSVASLVVSRIVGNQYANVLQSKAHNTS